MTTLTHKERVDIYNQYREKAANLKERLILERLKSKIMVELAQVHYYLKEQDGIRGRKQEVAVPKMIYKYMKDNNLSSVENLSVLDIGVGVPFMWGILNKEFGIKNFFGIDLIKEDTFSELLLCKNKISYEYYERDNRDLSKLLELKDKKFDIIISAIGDFDLSRFIPYAKEKSMLAYDCIYYATFNGGLYITEQENNAMIWKEINAEL